MLAPQIREKTPEKKDIFLDILWLYSAIDRVIEASRTIIELPSHDTIERLRLRTGYYAYTDSQSHMIWMAIEAWKGFRNTHALTLPIKNEDELALIFYIYICHDKEKEITLRKILSELWVKDGMEDIISLWENKPLGRKIRKDMI